MSRLWKGILCALAIEAAAIAIIFVCVRAAGTGWALPIAAMIGLPLLACTFPEKPKRRGYREAHRRARERYAIEIGDWPAENSLSPIAFDLSKKENA